MGVQHTGHALTHWFCKGFAETGGPRNTAKKSHHTTDRMLEISFAKGCLWAREGERERGKKKGRGREGGGRKRKSAGSDDAEFIGVWRKYHHHTRWWKPVISALRNGVSHWPLVMAMTEGRVSEHLVLECGQFWQALYYLYHYSDCPMVGSENSFWIVFWLWDIESIFASVVTVRLRRSPKINLILFFIILFI